MRESERMCGSGREWEGEGVSVCVYVGVCSCHSAQKGVYMKGGECQSVREREQRES